MARMHRVGAALLTVVAVGALLAACRTPIVQAACDGRLIASTTGTLKDPALIETSGLASSAQNPGVLWANNDSGDTARLFAISEAGATRVIYGLSGATAIDWEDIAIGPGPEANTPYIYAGDIGDNGEQRPNIVVYRVAEPIVVGDGGTYPLDHVDALTFTYPDGSHDAEALVVDPRTGEIYIVIKHLSGGPAAVYRAPAGLKDGSTTVLTKVGAVDLPRIPFVNAVTGADISRDGTTIAVRTYGGVRLWGRGANQSVIAALGADPCTGPIPVEVQGESIGIQPNGRGYFTASEGVNVPLHRFMIPK